MHIAARGITARKVVAQLLAALRRLGAVLAGVLPPAAHVALASALLQALATRIIGASGFFAAPPISSASDVQKFCLTE